ncbi:folate receptor beta-like [Lycorma delicatula]|uniref:folate receptor beta-like n=1 Tax=Lycorma delicatula TaxID=130591 RepID=UPI003F512A20
MFLFILFLNILSAVCGQLTNDQNTLLDWCLDSHFHKLKPGPESELYQQCSPWKERSCCTYNVTVLIHNDKNHHNFNLNHCSKEKNLSAACKQHFIQDLCFFECSPNIGPWVVKVDMKKRKERFYQVPLCRRNCNAWFEACKYDFTCSDNWYRNFNWDKNGNHCPPESKCATFEEVFTNATNFCEKVWDHSWQVVDDSEPCMTLRFNETSGNSNVKVAIHRANQILQFSSSPKLTVPVSSLIAVLLLLVPKFICIF